MEATTQQMHTRDSLAAYGMEVIAKVSAKYAWRRNGLAEEVQSCAGLSLARSLDRALDPAETDNPEAYVTKAVANGAIDALRFAKLDRERIPRSTPEMPIACRQPGPTWEAILNEQLATSAPTGYRMRTERTPAEWAAIRAMVRDHPNMKNVVLARMIAEKTGRPFSKNQVTNARLRFGKGTGIRRPRAGGGLALSDDALGKVREIVAANLGMKLIPLGELIDRATGLGCTDSNVSRLIRRVGLWEEHAAARGVRKGCKKIDHRSGERKQSEPLMTGDRHATQSPIPAYSGIS